jgi:TPR repeat protein
MACRTWCVMHHNGEGVPVNYVQAMHWFQMAADHGYLPAWFRSGGHVRAR